MTIDRQHGRIVIECEGCDTTVESDRGDDFVAFIEARKAAGWKVTKSGSEFVHLCPECKDQD